MNIHLQASDATSLQLHNDDAVYLGRFILSVMQCTPVFDLATEDY